MLRHICKSAAPGKKAWNVLPRGRTRVQSSRERWSSGGGGAEAPPKPDDDEKAPADHFAVLGVDRDFAQSADDLKSRYRRLMAAHHPDRHASSDEEDKARNASMATDVTRAYGALAQPLSRALHLLELHGAAIDESDNAAVDRGLLLEIMEAREDVEGASSDDELRPVLRSCRERQSAICRELGAAFREGRVDDAKSETAKLRYWSRVEDTILEKMSSVA